MIPPEVVAQSQKELRLSADAAFKRKKNKSHSLAQQHSDVHSPWREHVDEVLQRAGDCSHTMNNSRRDAKWYSAQTGAWKPFMDSPTVLWYLLSR